MGESANFGGGGGWDYDPKMWDSTGGAGMDYGNAAVEQNRLLLQQPMDVGGTVPGATLSTPGASPVGGDVLAGNAAPVAEPSALSKFHTGAMNQLTGAATMENVGKLLQSGVVANLGSIIAGPESTVGRIAGAIGGVQQTQRLNEARRKMIADQLGGGQGFQQGPAGSTIGLSGLDVLGLTSEQVTGLYDTALKTREAEREHPLKVMKAVGDLYRDVTTGNLSQAQIPHVAAQTEVLAAQAKFLPTKQQLEVDKQLQEIRKSVAETAETWEKAKTEPYKRAETEQRTINLGFEPNLKVAQTMETWASSSLKHAEANFKSWQVDPERHREDMEKARAMPWEIHSNPKGYTMFSKVTGGKEDVVVDASTPPTVVNELGLMMTTSTMMPFVKSDFDAKLPPGTKNAREEWANFLAAMSKEPTPEGKDRLVRGQLSPGNMNKYNQILDLYKAGIQNNVPTAALDNMARATILNTPLVVPKLEQPGQPFTDKPAAPAAAPVAKPTEQWLAPQHDKVVGVLKNQKAGAYTVNIGGKNVNVNWNGKDKAYVIP